jgi:NTP pyrophosphatase (non-canonical NTP hydrolase)
VSGQQADWEDWRIEVADWHPLPERFDCVAYLCTEVGETMDAALRLKRKGDDRSHTRKRSLGRELAQVIDMTYASAIRYGIDLDQEIADWRNEVRDRRPQGDADGRQDADHD